jgi:hypothetical protein
MVQKCCLIDINVIETKQKGVLEKYRVSGCSFVVGGRVTHYKFLYHIHTLHSKSQSVDWTRSYARCVEYGQV